MNRTYTTCLLTMTLIAAAGGCSQCRRFFGDRCADIPPGAIPPPAGSHTCAWQTAQALSAEPDDFVIYQYEWTNESAELGPFGRRHVEQLAARLAAHPFYVTVEPTENAELDAARRAAAVDRLAALGVLDADARVVLGYGVAEGLSGEEAPRLSQGYLGSRSIGSGTSAFGSSGAGGGLGGGGIGGSGGMGGFGGGGVY